MNIFSRNVPKKIDCTTRRSFGWRRFFRKKSSCIWRLETFQFFLKDKFGHESVFMNTYIVLLMKLKLFQFSSLSISIFLCAFHFIRSALITIKVLINNNSNLILLFPEIGQIIPSITSDFNII